MPRVPNSYLDARREEILAAAHRCFASRGFGNTRMVDIAREAGLSTGALYRYFESREELLHALAEKGRGVGRQLRRAAEASAPDDPYRQLVELVRSYLVQLGSHSPDMFRLSVQMWAEAVRHPSIAEEVRRTCTELQTYVTEMVERCRQVGSLRSDCNATEIARAVVALLNEVGLQRALEIEVDLAEYGRTIEALLDGLREDQGH